MKQVATILVPMFHNDKTLVDGTVHAKVADVACSNWGGFTVSHVHGGWKDPTTDRIVMDNLVKYEIAMEHTQENRRGLVALAQYVAQEAAQAEIYIVHAAGDVEFVKPPKPYQGEL